MNIMAKTIREHTCKIIKNIDSVGVEKIKLPNDKDQHWFLRFDTTLNEIKFCPYCGIDLESE